MLTTLLIKLVRDAISEAFDKTSLIDKSKLIEQHPDLQKLAATFVTLTLDGQLRGCIGSLTPHKILFDDVVSNAHAAAFKDPRFLPLSKEEFSKVIVEVSLLSKPQEFEYKSLEELKKKITHEHGVILRHRSYQATFLPQVWEELPSFELFFSHLCQKAGMDASCLEQHPQISLYTVEKFKE